MDQALHREVVCQRQDRLLTTLERLLELPTTDVNSTLNQVVQLVGEALTAEKVDAFLHDVATDTLMAHGTVIRRWGSDSMPSAWIGCS